MSGGLDSTQIPLLEEFEEKADSLVAVLAGCAIIVVLAAIVAAVVVLGSM